MQNCKAFYSPISSKIVFVWQLGCFHEPAGGFLHVALHVSNWWWVIYKTGVLGLVVAADSWASSPLFNRAADEYCFYRCESRKQYLPRRSFLVPNSLLWMIMCTIIIFFLHCRLPRNTTYLESSCYSPTFCGLVHVLDVVAELKSQTN